MYKEKIVQLLLSLSTCIFITSMVKICKLSMVIGSWATFFSLNNAILPLSGLWLGMPGASILCLMKMLMSMFFIGGLFPFHYLAFHIPGLCAAYYWASPSLFIRMVLPLVCIVLFIMHPIGGHAWLYAISWFIPVILYYVPRQSLFLSALGSTLTAHAVGSVIWLYTVPMPATVWIQLIPLALCERLFFALSMGALCWLYYHGSQRVTIFYRKQLMPLWQ